MLKLRRSSLKDNYEKMKTDLAAAMAKKKELEEKMVALLQEKNDLPLQVASVSRHCFEIPACTVRGL